MEPRRVTPSVKLITHTPNPETAIALAAKLCYSDADISELSRGVEAADGSKFIAMLLRLGHLSTFEHASFSFGIEGVSRALLAQITRHRIASFSVKSQRYVGADKKFCYILPPAIEALGEEAKQKFERQMETMHGWYKEWQAALGEGEKANEDARFVLPNASETKMIVTMNARELIHFFSLRCCNRAQWEIREVAWEMLKLVSAIAPNVFSKSGPDCLCGACPEGAKTCGQSAQVKQKRTKLL